MSTFLSITLASQFSSAQLLDAIGHAESGMNHASIGDHGHSIGLIVLAAEFWFLAMASVNRN